MASNAFDINLVVFKNYNNNNQISIAVITSNALVIDNTRVS